MKHRKFLVGFCVVAAVGFAVAVACAQPVIYSISGKPIDGNQVKLLGTGFGVKGTAAPVLYDTIDNIEAYEEHNLAHGDTMPAYNDGDCDECPWKINFHVWNNYNPVLYYDSTNVRVVERPAYHMEGAGFMKGFHPFAAGLTENAIVHMSWWIRANHNLYDMRPEGGTVFNKLVRYVTDIGDDFYEGHVEIESQGIAGHLDSCGTTIQFLSVFPELPPHSWHHIELFYDGGGDLPNGSGHVYATFDGVNVCDCDGIFSCTGLPDCVYLWGSDPTPSDDYPGDSEILFSEFYMDTTRARVILSSSSDYVWQNEDSTHYEIQPPYEWSGSCVKIIFNAGVLADARNQYLYVIDADGNVSPGFALPTQ